MSQTQNKQLKPKSRKSTKTSVSAFISKTYEILEDAKYTEIIDWNPEGTAIMIKKPIEFANEVLSTYFKHKNLTSFVRQLNMYSFHKQRTHKIEHIYHHELFQRGKKYLLEQIKRKNQDQISIEQEETNDEVSSVSSDQELSKIMQEKQALKRFNLQASDRINCLEGKIKDLNVQNRALKARITQQEERDKIVISLMGNLLRKYGIPPAELCCILPEFQAHISNEGFDMADHTTPHHAESVSDVQTGISEAEIDVSGFFNFGEEYTQNKIAEFEPAFKTQIPLEHQVYDNNYFIVKQIGQNDSNLMKRNYTEIINNGQQIYNFESLNKKFEVNPYVGQNW